MYVNRPALPDYDYYAYKYRNRPPKNADERYLTTLRREKDRSTSMYNAWRTFFAYEGGDVTDTR